MKPYAEMTKEELVALRKDLKAKYHDFQTKDLRLDMSRGKPSADQLDLSMGMMDVLSSDDDLTCEDGTDCRNYGVLTGIDEGVAKGLSKGEARGSYHKSLDIAKKMLLKGMDDDSIMELTGLTHEQLHQLKS